MRILIAVVEMSQSSWLVAAIVPGLDRHPLTKISPDETTLLGLLLARGCKFVARLRTSPTTPRHIDGSGRALNTVAGLGPVEPTHVSSRPTWLTLHHRRGLVRQA
jgi:hypothetical protein